MKIKNRFYCSKCKKLIDRRSVTYDEWNGKYYCKWCENPVMRAEKLLEVMIMDYADYSVAHGEEKNYE